MKRVLFLVITALVIVVVAASGFAQDPASPAQGSIVAPTSTLNRTPGGVHTPLYIYIPAEGINPASIPNGETPASLACIYGVVPPTTGCPKNGTLVPTGGARAIAVVEFGRDTTVQSDLDTFSTQFGLPHTTITEICTPGPPPCQSNAGTGWDVETALDVEYAHAMAPNAQIIVAEFTNDPLTDGAETQAAAAVAAAGGGEVSNSWTYNNGEGWCSPPANCELSFDHYFTTHGVVYFGSAGDSGLGVAYPSVSPNVVSAGGTRIMRDSNGNFTSESCWSGSGGGISQVEILPQYQFIIMGKAGAHRGTPDLSADAAPASGVDVFSTTGCGGWCIVGGTSVSSPVLAGIVNAAGGFLGNTNAELSKTYHEYKNPVEYRTNFFDVTTGSNGSPAGPGWDQCTGIGSPRKLSGL
jgi:kumamolisin